MRRPAQTSLLRPAAGGPLILSAGAGLASTALAAAGIVAVEMGQPWLTALALPPILLLMLACAGLTVHAVRRGAFGGHRRRNRPSISMLGKEER